MIETSTFSAESGPVGAPNDPRSLQDFGLGPLRQQSDLVEEERAATGGLKESELGLPRVSECTLLVAE